MAAINWNQFIEAAAAAGEDTGDFTPVPADSYDANVEKATAKKTKNGKDMISVGFVIDGGPYNARWVWTNLVVSPESPKAMAILIRQLTALGVRPLLDANASMEQIAAGMLKAPATIKVSVGEYQGKPKNEVDGIAPRQASAVPNVPIGGGLPAGPAGLPI